MCRPDYRKATSYCDPRKEKFVQPDWIETNNCGLTYSPSTNVAPTEVMPVLISKDHELAADEMTSRIIKPMMWGMIPPWHKVTLIFYVLILFFTERCSSILLAFIY